MIREIKHYGDPALRRISEKVEVVDDSIIELLNDMAETMYAAPGVGLAAPQIGVNKRAIVIDTDGFLIKAVNPEIIESSAELATAEEGCLSIPGVYEKVKRAKSIKVRYISEKGEVVEREADELLARAFQHEIDHLDGNLFVDKISTVAKKLSSQKLARLKKDTMKKMKKEI